MSEVQDFNGDSNTTEETYVFAEYLHNTLKLLLDSSIPEKVKIAAHIRDKIEKTLHENDLFEETGSQLYWTQDLKTDGIPSFRILLKPHGIPNPLYGNESPILFKGSPVRETIVNVPIPFIGEPNELKDISVAIVSFSLANGESPTYTFSHDEVIPFDFRKLDLDFDGDTIAFKVIQDPAVVSELSPEQRVAIKEQYEVVHTLQRILSEYRLVPQSRHDGTMDKLQ